MSAADDDKVCPGEEGLFLDVLDGAAFNQQDRGFNFVFPAEILELLSGIVKHLLAVVLVIDVDGRVGITGSVEEDEFGTERASHGGSGFGDSDRFVFEADGAEYGFDGPGGVSSVIVCASPDRAGDIMEYLGDNGAEEQAAERTAAAGGHHDQIGTVALDKICNDFGCFTTLDDLRMGVSGKELGSEIAKLGFVSALNVGRDGEVERAEIAVEGDWEFIGVQEDDRAIEMLSHLADERGHGAARLREVYREKDLAER